MKFQTDKILALFRSAIVAVWIYCGFAVFLLTGGLVNLQRNKKKFRRRAQGDDTRPIKNKPPVNRVLAARPLPVVSKKSGINSHAWPKPIFHRKRRKRIFNYPQFYMSVVRELSSHSHTPASTVNGTSPANSHANEHTNGHPGGHTAPNGATAIQSVKSETRELIAGQEILIQKQRSLIDQQARLIEEKNRIIEEQSAFLKSQLDLGADRRAAA